MAEGTDPDLVVHTIVGGMRVAAYLPTRTFELCVHGLDIAAATGIPVDLPAASRRGGLRARGGLRGAARPRTRPAAGDDGPARPAPGLQRRLTNGAQAWLLPITSVPSESTGEMSPNTLPSGSSR